MTKMVRRNHDGDPPLCQSLKHAGQAPSSGRVQTVVRFVQEQQVRTSKHRRRQREPLPHALTEAVEHVVRTLVDADQTHHTIDEVQPPPVHDGEFHQRGSGRCTPLPTNLFRHVPNTTSPLRGVENGALSINNAPLLHLQHTCKGSEEGGFSRAVPSNEADDCSTGELKVDVMNSRTRPTSKPTHWVRHKVAVRHPDEPHEMVHVSASNEPRSPQVSTYAGAGQRRSMSYVVPCSLAVACGVVAALHRRTTREAGANGGWSDGNRLKIVLGLLVVAWWFVPGGVVLAGGLITVVSLVSPAGRLDWFAAWRGRFAVVAVVLGSMVIGGLIPVVSPTVVSDFGPALTLDDPSGWPRASETVHVVSTGDEALDVAIVAVRTMHVPWQGASTGMAGGVLLIADLTGQAERELERTVLLLDEAGGPRLDEGLIGLDEVASSGSHTFRLDGDRTELAARRWEVQSELGGFGAQSVAEVVVIGVPTSTGVVEMLTVVRPIGHPDVVTDPFAEDLVEAWWSARNAMV